MLQQVDLNIRVSITHSVRPALSNGLRPLPPPPGLWILGVGVDFSFWSDLGKSSMIWFFEGYDWIRTKKLIWLLPFSGQIVRQLSSSCPSSFPNLTFWPISGLSKISPTSWFSKNLRFFWGPSWGFDLGKSSTIWFFEGFGWICIEKLICLLPFSGQMARQLSSLCPSKF